MRWYPSVRTVQMLVVVTVHCTPARSLRATRERVSYIQRMLGAWFLLWVQKVASSNLVSPLLFFFTLLLLHYAVHVTVRRYRICLNAGYTTARQHTANYWDHTLYPYDMAVFSAWTATPAKREQHSGMCTRACTYTQRCACVSYTAAVHEGKCIHRALSARGAATPAAVNSSNVVATTTSIAD